jgi:hypothetical protein
MEGKETKNLKKEIRKKIRRKARHNEDRKEIKTDRREKEDNSVRVVPEDKIN